MLWQPVLVSLTVIVAAWVTLLLFLLVARPENGVLRGLRGMLPDAVRLVSGVAGDRSLPSGSRRPLRALLAYLAMPFDPVPAFVPVVGGDADTILTAVALRRLFRTVGPTKLAQHWPGTHERFAALCRMFGLASA